MMMVPCLSGFWRIAAYVCVKVRVTDWVRVKVSQESQVGFQKMWNRTRNKMSGGGGLRNAQAVVQLVLLLGNLYACSATGIFAGLCPEPLCDCRLDARGRMEISCLNGQMTDIPMSKMNPSTEVIKIIGPPEKPNYLTIGRMFRQFKRLEELHIVSRMLYLFLKYVRIFLRLSSWHIFIVYPIIQGKFTKKWDFGTLR